MTLPSAHLVVNWKTLTGTPGVRSLWALPTLLGSPIIGWVQHQVRLGKGPTD